MNTHGLINESKKTANKLYGYLEDLRDLLFELINDENINIYDRNALYECLQVLNEVELLDEIIARLGCINFNDGDDD
jgi:hypothetical protein